MTGQRTILHVDLDAFYCAVEERLNPGLRGKAFVVGGRPEERGVVASASYAARQYGIRSAMSTARALRLCPGLLVLPARGKLYQQASRAVMARLRRETPLLEQVSIDEAYLDVSGDPRGGEAIAAALQREIRQGLGLPTSWGVATSKLVARIATEMGKPGGLVVVPPGEEAAFLAPLPVGMLPGVGPKTEKGLKGMGVATIGDLAALTPAALRPLFGRRAPDMLHRARGVDPRPVVPWREPKSRSAETTFPRDVVERETLERTLRRLAERVARRLRREGLAGSTVRLKIRWPDFITQTRQMQLPQPTGHEGEIYAAARGLLAKVWRPGQPVRLIGVGVAGLGPAVRQLRLFEGDWEREERLLRALESIKARYGPDAVRRGDVLEGD